MSLGFSVLYSSFVGGASGQQCLDLEDYPHLRKWCREYSTISMAVENGVVYTAIILPLYLLIILPLPGKWS